MAHEDFQDQLDRLRESANDSARSFRTAYTFFLVISLYILAIVSTTDHELLFRDGAVDLPIINIGVSVGLFFISAPLILVILHFNLLIQGLFLSDKIYHYVAELDRYSLSRNKRIMELSYIFPVPLALKIANGNRQWSTRILLNTMVFISIALLSPAIMIYAQIQFLPYQDVFITWWHRILVLTDIILLWWLWPRIAAPKKKWHEWISDPRQASIMTRSRWRASISNPLHLVFTSLMLVATIAVFFILVIADFPGGSVSMWSPKLELFRNYFLLERRYSLSGRIIVSKEPSSEILSAYYRASCESDTYGSNSCDESTIEIGSSSWCKHAKPVQLENRNMRSANLSNTILCGAGLENTNLYDANISGANLRDARLRDADLREADLSEADLRGARLLGADLRKADLSEADLRDARLKNADLRGSRLLKTDLRGALLERADLRNIKFGKFSWLRIRFIPPDLRDTNLSLSNSDGTFLSRTSLSGADLSSAKFRGANLSGADLHGVDLTGAFLHGANLSGAILSGSNLSRADLRGANLSGAKLHGADLSKSDLRGADLKGSELVGAQLIETKFDLADLRDIDFSNQSDMNIKMIKDIGNPRIKAGALKRIDNAKIGKTLIEALSLNDAILCKTEYIYAELRNSDEMKLLGQAPYIVECIMEAEAKNYFDDLVTYLSALACEDESGYIAKGIAQRTLLDEELGSKLAGNLLNECPEITLKMLSEQERDRLNTISEGLETSSQ